VNPTKRIPVSVVVPTRDEEAAIAACVRALSDFDQVIVVDSNSSDRTQVLAKEAGAEVVDYVWDGKYPKKKQWCLDNLDLRHDWVLFVDADEAPSRQLVTEIRTLAANGRLDQHAAYDIALDYHFLHRRLRFGHRVVKRALVHRARTVFPVLDDLAAPGMGEQEGHYQPVANGTVGTLGGRLSHDDRDPFSTWIARHNRYSDWEAHLIRDPDLSRHVQDLRSGRGRRYRRTPFKPVAFFLYSYVLRQGFRDGRAGFHYAVAHAFYFWQISVKSQENSAAGVMDPRGKEASRPQ
jgi:glycosyltransferase involved in cell wall biosynthesis